MNRALSRPWFRGALAGLAVLVVLAPVFAWASTAVGYAEPLDAAAAAAGATDAATASASLLPGYAVPGLSGAAGTLASALVGTALTLAVGVGVGRLLER